VFGYELGASWSAIQVCNTETTFAWNVLGFNFGAYIALIVAIGAIGLLYSRMR
jgi:alpha/beta superfamily hydrolase